MDNNQTQQPQEELTAEAYSELIQIRRDKLTALQQAGQDPFEKTSWPQSDFAADIKANFKDPAEGEHGESV